MTSVLKINDKDENLILFAYYDQVLLFPTKKAKILLALDISADFYESIKLTLILMIWTMSDPNNIKHKSFIKGKVISKYNIIFIFFQFYVNRLDIKQI